MGKDTAKDHHSGDAFFVDPWTHFIGGLAARRKGFFKWLGNVETWFLADAIDDIPIEKPLYITGLARAGSTILLEILSRHPDVVTHRYRDFPLLLTPFMWNRYLDRTPRKNDRPAERSHKDGILVTPESPEAFEEVLWMAFFADLHDPETSAVLDETHANPAFNQFYRAHIRKLLMLRNGSRYAAKGNYNITRMRYLLDLFADARFVIPVRDPVWHIASLMKQHRLFCEGQTANPRAVTHLQRAGHFEFGLDRRPVNLGDPAKTQEIISLWENGDEVAGWAVYWGQVHHFIADCLEAPGLNAAAMVIHFDTFCDRPAETLREMLSHCGLSIEEDFIAAEADRIHPPAYYRPQFTDRELAVIERYTAAAARRIFNR